MSLCLQIVRIVSGGGRAGRKTAFRQSDIFVYRIPLQHFIIIIYQKADGSDPFREMLFFRCEMHLIFIRLRALKDRFEAVSQQLQHKHKSRQYYKKRKIEQGKFFNIGACFSGIMLDIFPEGDQACQRGDQRSDPTDINAHEQFRIVPGKLRQQYCRRDIADDLT